MGSTPKGESGTPSITLQNNSPKLPPPPPKTGAGSTPKGESGTPSITLPTQPPKLDAVHGPKFTTNSNSGPNDTDEYLNQLENDLIDWGRKRTQSQSLAENKKTDLEKSTSFYKKLKTLSSRPLSFKDRTKKIIPICKKIEEVTIPQIYSAEQFKDPQNFSDSSQILIEMNFVKALGANLMNNTLKAQPFIKSIETVLENINKPTLSESQRELMKDYEETLKELCKEKKAAVSETILSLFLQKKPFKTNTNVPWSKVTRSK